jgi:hypothetical protein
VRSGNRRHGDLAAAPAGRPPRRAAPAGASLTGRAPAATVWFDGTRLRLGQIHPGGLVTQRALGEVSAAPLPLVRADQRVYWVDPAGTFVPAPGHWSQVVRYLSLATGATGTAGPADPGRSRHRSDPGHPGARLALGQDSGWARWLPGAARLIVGTAAGAGYLVDAATLSATPLSYARGTGDGQGLNYTVAVVPLPR